MLLIFEDFQNYFHKTLTILRSLCEKEVAEGAAEKSKQKTEALPDFESTFSTIGFYS